MHMAAPTLNTHALIELYRQNNVARLSVFGSFARGEATERSDVDLLVEFNKRNSLLALIALERKMSAALGRRVDLLTREAISPYLRDSIDRDLRVVYEAG
jgi:predicted nucleotidyltransferase